MFKKEAHEYLTNKGCLSIGQKYTAFEIEEMLNEFAQQQVKNLNIPAVIGRSEQLVAFLKWVGDGYDFENNAEKIVKEYIDEGN